VIWRLLAKYRDVPMDFADACLVRMTELHAESTIRPSTLQRPQTPPIDVAESATTERTSGIRLTTFSRKAQPFKFHLFVTKCVNAKPSKMF
jgi:hypothetical protein